MGNSKSKQNKLLASAELSQPGQPRVSLAHDRMSPFHAENTEAVSDEVVLNWSPCTINDKVEPVISYNTMWLKICYRGPPFSWPSSNTSFQLT